MAGLAQARVSFRTRPNFVSKFRTHFTKFRARSTQISGVFCFALGYSAIALALARSARIDTHLTNITQYSRTCYTLHLLCTCLEAMLLQRIRVRNRTMKSVVQPAGCDTKRRW